MARTLRMDYPGTFYHILARGNERKEIFRDEKDYLRFLDTLGKMVERFKLEVHAYVRSRNSPKKSLHPTGSVRRGALVLCVLS
jgi:REP element-mobilizing transposase RayT